MAPVTHTLPWPSAQVKTEELKHAERRSEEPLEQRSPSVARSPRSEVTPSREPVATAGSAAAQHQQVPIFSEIS